MQEFQPDLIAAIESRGFIFAAPIAYKLGLGWLMVRKVGKLPGAVISHSYDLEYGSDTLQIADGLICPGARVVLVDDLIATGGTAQASVTLLRKVGADVAGAVFLVELEDLGGCAKLGVREPMLAPARRPAELREHAPGLKKPVALAEDSPLGPDGCR